MKNLVLALIAASCAISAAHADLGDTYEDSCKRWKSISPQIVNKNWIDWSWPDSWIIEQFHGSRCAIEIVLDGHPEKDVTAQGLRIFRHNYAQVFHLTSRCWDEHGQPMNCYASADGNVLADITFYSNGSALFRIGYRTWWERHHLIGNELPSRDGNAPVQDNQSDDLPPVQDDQVSN